MRARLARFRVGNVSSAQVTCGHSCSRERSASSVNPVPAVYSTAPPDAVPEAAMAATEPSYARLDVFARGAIWGMSVAGAQQDHIIDVVRKKDGTSPSLRAVTDILARKRDHPEWRGEDTHNGRPKLLTHAQRDQLVGLVFAERGKAKVTVKFCKKRLPFLRDVGRHTVERELQGAGLRWLRRCAKTYC